MCRTEFILDERFEYIDSTYTFTGSTGKENVSWKFDTFEWGDNLNGIIPYDTAGSFPIKMAYSDYSGKCIDTITQMVDIVKVTADFTSSNEANICEKLVKFTDLSEVKQEGNIVSWYWDFDDQLSSSELQNPYHYFLKKGVYNISLTVRSEEGCTDKITKQIDLQGPQPFFDFITDTVGCYPLTVGFVNKSTKSKVFIWEWGDNSGSTDVTQLGEDTVYFTYNQEGFYYPRITAFDTVYNEDNYYVCQDYYPNFDYGQPQRVVEVIDSVNLDFDLPPIVCQGDPIKIVNNTGAPFLVYYGIENSKPFGILGTTLRSSNSDTGFMHYTFYANTGNDRPSCSDTFTDSVYVDYVEAGFAYCISNEDSLLQTISTTNQSTYRATSYLWSDKNYFTNFSYQKEPDIQFDSGFTSYRLCLDATTSFGCTDQYCAQVYIPRLIPYNVFTPDGDGLNDTYDVSIVHENFYELAIYNRWGELVFISNQDGTDFDGNNWNGTYMNQGKDLPEGNYYYTIKYAFDTCEEEIFTIEGSITLIR